MKTYARVQDGVVAELIPPMTYDADYPAVDPDAVVDSDAPPYSGPSWKKGDEIPIESRYNEALIIGPVSIMVDISALNPQPDQGWTYDGTKFAAPAPYVPSPDEIKAANTATRDSLLAQATAAIAPLQDAVDLDMATDSDTAALKAWKTYRVLVNRIDLTQASPTWPTAPAA